MQIPPINTAVKLQWLDSTRLPGWHYFKATEKVDTTPRLMVSRGLLVGSDELAVALTGTVTPRSALDTDEGYADILIVPRGCIVSVEEIP